MNSTPTQQEAAYKYLDRPDILENIAWFSKLSPSQKIRAVETANRALRRLQQLRPTSPHPDAEDSPRAGQ